MDVILFSYFIFSLITEIFPKNMSLSTYHTSAYVLSMENCSRNCAVSINLFLWITWHHNPICEQSQCIFVIHVVLKTVQKKHKQSLHLCFLPRLDFYVKCGESERCWSLRGRRIFLFVGVEIEGESEHPYMGMPSTFSPYWLQAFCSCLSTKWPSSIAFRGPTNYFCFGEIVLKLWFNKRDDHFF